MYIAAIEEGLMSNPNPVIPIREEASSGPDATPTRIFLQPIAAPSILGLYGFSLATFVVAVGLMGWYGGLQGGLLVVPFAAMCGGLAQFAAGMWSFRARDALATAFHGLWGAFWFIYGLIGVLFAAGALVVPGGEAPHFGWWFVVLAATTWVLATAAAQQNRALSWFLALLAAGSTLMFIAEFAPRMAWPGIVAGYFFVLSAMVAWAIASVMVLHASGRTVFGRIFSVRSARQPRQMAGGSGEPGVIRGQA
jgi:succinate-acetate transporter protein